MRKPSPRTTRIATFAAGLVVAFGLVAMLFAIQVSSTPTFCGSCHIMKPYYESWKKSGHANVACVECHIPPGITAEFRKKYEALAMVAKYFTGTYSTNPWVEVDDAACLRCHERRLLEGKVVFHGVLFDHTPHLTESRRGLKLRCTSCHSQIVQGSHIAVTVSTCALCHFMGQGVNQGFGRCLRCHAVPERVTTLAGTSFDHSEVKRLAMDCASCHEGVVRGDGTVPRERCVTCHNQQDRLARYGDRDFLHFMHVSKHKVN
ncbi:MAG: NapC/NirT family cytochrome c, partial [Candidatus Eiseniibacteriota bacterium]